MDIHIPTHPNSQLRQERIRRNWRQRDLADQLGTTVVTVNRWERGIQEPNAYFRVKLCALFGKSAEELGIIPSSTQPLHMLEDTMPEKHLIVSTSPEEALVSSVSSSEELLLLQNTSLHSRRPAYWNIPFVRNPFFTGRAYELEQLHTQLHQQHIVTVGQTQAISGLGGIGKTQLVIEYAYRYYQEYQSVLWVRAESAEALNSSYIELASLLNLPEKEAKEQEIIVQAVKTWLETHSEWLLILDNLDESEETLFPPDLNGKQRRPSPFLPVVSAGHLLITARATDLSAVGLGIAHPLHLETFPNDQGIHLLLHRADLLDQATSQDREVALSITQELGGLALALDQAGAYIAATRIGLDTYLHLFQKHQTDLLKQRRNRDYPESVATTWTISFQRVEFRNPAATELLSLCAFFAPDAIPEEIFTEGTEEINSTLVPVAADPFLLNNAIEDLLTYSLIVRDPHVQTLSVHRLIRAVIRNSMSTETQQQWMQRAVHTVEAAFPESTERDNWPAIERLLPHALICATWIEQAAFTTSEALRLLKKIGLYLNARANYRDAEPLLHRALALCEQLLGVDHLDTAIYRNALAMNAVNQGKYAEAEPLLMSALLLSEQKLGTIHPDTIQQRNTLAELYRVQGKFNETELLLENMYTPNEHLEQANDPFLVNSLTILALVYWDQLKFDKAAPLREYALTLFEHLAPETDHLHMAALLTNLAILSLNQGEDAKAETLFLRTISIVEQWLATNHIFSAISLNNLAELYSVQGKNSAAEQLYRQALTLSKQLSGVDHPYTALCLNNLAGFFVRQGKFTEAEPLYRQTLTIREEKMESMHPDIAQSLNNLAIVFMNQGKYREAEPLLERTQAIFEYQYGSQHFYTVFSLNNLAEFYRIQEKFTRAETLYQQVFALYVRQLGNEHSYTVLWRDILARFFESQRKFIGGEPLSLSPQMLVIREMQWGPIIETRIRALTTWLCFV